MEKFFTSKLFRRFLLHHRKHAKFYSYAFVVFGLWIMFGIAVDFPLSDYWKYFFIDLWCCVFLIPGAVCLSRFLCFIADRLDAEK